jgi:hypothetical protein
MKLPEIRDEIARLYHGKMTITEYTKTKDKNGISKLKLERIRGGIPCRLSYKRKAQNAAGADASDIQLETVIYCDPDIEIKPGSVIEVTQEGHTETFELSGGVVRYHNHQEVFVCKNEARA